MTRPLRGFLVRESGFESTVPGGVRWSLSGPGLKLGVGGKPGRAVQRGAGSVFKESEASLDWDEEAEPGLGSWAPAAALDGRGRGQRGRTPGPKGLGTLPRHFPHGL